MKDTTTSLPRLAVTRAEFAEIAGLSQRTSDYLERIKALASFRVAGRVLIEPEKSIQRLRELDGKIPPVNSADAKEAIALGIDAFLARKQSPKQPEPINA